MKKSKNDRARLEACLRNLLNDNSISSPLQKKVSEVTERLLQFNGYNEDLLEKFFAPKAQQSHLKKYLLSKTTNYIFSEFSDFLRSNPQDTKVLAAAPTKSYSEKAKARRQALKDKLDSKPAKTSSNLKFLETNNLYNETNFKPDWDAEKKHFDQSMKDYKEEFPQENLSDLLCPFSHDYKFEELLDEKFEGKVTNDSPDVRGRDSLARLMSLEGSKCCAVSVLEKSHLKEDSIHARRLATTDQLIVGYNNPEKNCRTANQFKEFALQKANLILGFYASCVELNKRILSEKKEHRKTRFEVGKLILAENTIRKLSAAGGFGIGNARTPQKFRRLVIDLLKVESRIPNFPEIVTILACDFRTKKQSPHAEQHVMEYYINIVQDLKPKHVIIIGSEKLYCVDCLSSSTFLNQTFLRVTMRGYSSIKFPNTQCFILKLDLKECCKDYFNNINAFFTNKSKNKSSIDPKQRLRPPDSDSDAKNLDIKVPKYGVSEVRKIFDYN